MVSQIAQNIRLQSVINDELILQDILFWKTFLQLLQTDNFVINHKRANNGIVEQLQLCCCIFDSSNVSLCIQLMPDHSLQLSQPLNIVGQNLDSLAFLNRLIYTGPKLRRNMSMFLLVTLNHRIQYIKFDLRSQYFLKMIHPIRLEFVGTVNKVNNLIDLA